MSTEATEQGGAGAPATEVASQGGGDAATDAAALSAAREAMGVAEPDAPAGAPPTPANAPASDAAALTELQQLRAEIKARENETKARQKLETEYEGRFKTSIEAERAKLQTEVRAALVEEYKQKLRTRPAETITNDFGIDGAALVTDLAHRAGPAGAALAEIAELKAKLSKLETGGTSEVAKLRAEIEAERKAARDAQAAQSHEASAKQLVNIVTEKAPAALAYYGDASGMMTRAQSIAQEYCEAKGVDVCPYNVIVAELESEAKAGVAARVKTLEAQLASLKSLQQPAGLAGKPTELNGRTTSTRTLSASSASERRASPKPLAEQSQEELDKAMRDAAREAMGPTKKARSA